MKPIASRVALRHLLAGTWGYFPWEGDRPADEVWAVQDAVDITPAVDLLRSQLRDLQSPGEYWNWVGTVFLAAEAFHGLPKSLIRQAFQIVEDLPDNPDFQSWESSWKDSERLEPARQEVLRELQAALNREERNGRVPLYRSSMKTSAKRVAFRYSKRS